MSSAAHGPAEDYEWDLDWFLADCEHVQQHPPAAPDGMERIECDRHWPTYVAHVDGMYPAPCYQCIIGSQGEQIAALEHRSHHRWWKWGAYRWLARHGYSWGLIAGSSWGNMCSHCGIATRITWRGKRPYILGQRREWWECLLRYRHLRTEHVGCGLCTVCLPCPDCGSTATDHNVCEATR